jgi:uncharacterized membrane-anchored protein YhcB (DUF1043 family)
MQTWQHCILWLVIGFIIGYYFTGLGNATLGKIYTKPS